MDQYQLELENRIKNLMWTVSNDYTLEMKPDVDAFLQSKYIALYDGIKQGAFAKYFNREEVSLYLVKKLYLQAMEAPLLTVAQLCIEEAVYEKIVKERVGIASVRQKAFEDLLDKEFARLSATPLGHLKIALLREGLDGRQENTKLISEWLSILYQLRVTEDTMDIIRAIDMLYNRIVEPKFEEKKGSLDRVLGITLEELTEFSWKDFLSEEMYEDALESYVEKVTENMTALDMPKRNTEEEKPDDVQKKKVLLVDKAALEKMYTYVSRNYGQTYLTEAEEKKLTYHLCRGIHRDCSLYFTEGILKAPVIRNYQYEYARKTKDKNLFEYYDNHRIVKRNISILSDMLKKAFALREENQRIRSDRGSIIPSSLWKVGRSSDARLFQREIKNDAMDFVVDVLIDASGSQRIRQGKVAIQAYIISEALSDVGIPHRVMSFCTFWDYTIMHRFRKYDEDRSANANIFEYITSSNNRDGLAVKAVGYELLQREEENKVLIVLSDGRPYDVILNRPNARNPKPYQGEYAVKDTGYEVRKLRNMGVSVLGVFAGEERDLATEKKIFGKDFAYIRDIGNFSNIVGRYLQKQLE